MSVAERPQCLEALSRANDVRRERARIKAGLREGRLRIVDVLVDPPSEVGSMRVADLLLQVPRVGRAKASVLLKLSGVSLATQVGRMTSRQCGELVRVLGGRDV